MWKVIYGLKTMKEGEEDTFEGKDDGNNDEEEEKQEEERRRKERERDRERERGGEENKER